MMEAETFKFSHTPLVAAGNGVERDPLAGYMEEEADMDYLLPKQPVELIAEFVHFVYLRQKMCKAK